LGWALVLTFPARLGFDQAPLRYVPVYLDTNELGKLRGFVCVALGTVLTLSIIISVLFVVVGIATKSASPLVLIAAACIIPPQALLGVVSVTVRSAKQVFASQFYDQLLRPAFQIGILLGLVAVGVNIGPAHVLAVAAISATTALAILFVPFRRIFADARRSQVDYTLMSNWFAVSLPLLAITFGQELLNQLEVILLGFLGDAREAGLFAGAWRLASLVTFSLSSFGLVCGPLVATEYHRSNFVELNKLIRFAARLTAASGALVIVLLVLTGRSLLGLMGPDFVAAYPTLIVLLAGGAVNAGTGIVAYLLTLTGHERVAALIFGIALILSLTLNILLIPVLGSMGAAIASSATVSMWNITMVFYVRRTLGIDASILCLPLRNIRAVR
jgi:O-antigen/teichoic acid export membrane protein